VTYKPSEIDVSAPTGTYQPGPRNMVFTIHTAPHTAKPVEYADDGRPHQIKLP